MPHLPAVVGLLLAATAATAQPAADPPRPAPLSRTSDTPSLADLLAAARSALARGDTPLALSLATRAVESAPTDPRCYALRAAAHDARRDFAASVADYTKLLSLAPDTIAALHRRGEAHFRLGHFRDSVADFDREISLDPSREPHHWQRGLSLYYAGDYARGARQFELHQTVNPDDVENAAWHYLCVAKEKGVEAARKSLIPIPPGSDTRVPLNEIYALYAGRFTPDEVIAAARAGDPPEAELKQRLMYAHLYVGLWFSCGAGVPPAKPEDKEAGRMPAPQQKEKEHITLAAEKYAGDDYMSDVARVHAATFAKQPKPD
jgi:lipoprotein NlpI